MSKGDTKSKEKNTLQNKINQINGSNAQNLINKKLIESKENMVIFNIKPSLNSVKALQMLDEE